MSRILKVPLPSTGATAIRLGSIEGFLAVGWQGDQLVGWVMGEPGDREVAVAFVALTGDPVPPGAYVGTAVLMFGLAPYVVHVFWDRLP